MRMSALFGAKTPKFSKFMAHPHGQEGLSQCGQGRREGSIFCDFVRTFFMNCTKDFLVPLAQKFFSKKNSLCLQKVFYSVKKCCSNDGVFEN